MVIVHVRAWVHRWRGEHESAAVNLQVMREPLECKASKFDCHDQVSGSTLHEHGIAIAHEQDLEKGGGTEENMLMERENKECVCEKDERLEKRDLPKIAEETEKKHVEKKKFMLLCLSVSHSHLFPSLHKAQLVLPFSFLVVIPINDDSFLSFFLMLRTSMQEVLVLIEQYMVKTKKQLKEAPSYVERILDSCSHKFV